MEEEYNVLTIQRRDMHICNILNKEILLRMKKSLHLDDLKCTPVSYNYFLDRKQCMKIENFLFYKRELTLQLC